MNTGCGPSTAPGSVGDDDTDVMGLSFPGATCGRSTGVARRRRRGAPCTDVRPHAVVAPAGGTTSTDGPSSHPALRPVTTARGAATGSAQPPSPGQDGHSATSTLVRMAAPAAPPGATSSGPNGRHARLEDGPAGPPGRSRRRLATAPVRRGPWPYVATADAPATPVPDAANGYLAPSRRRKSPLITLAPAAPATTTVLPGSPAAPTAHTGVPGLAPVAPVAPVAPRGLAAPPTVPPPDAPTSVTRGVGHRGVRRAARPRPGRRTARPAARARRARPAAPTPRADPSRPRAGHARRRLPSRLGPAAARALTCAAGEGHAAQVGRAPSAGAPRLAESCRWARST